MVKGGIRQRLGISSDKPKRTKLGSFFLKSYLHGRTTSHELRQGCIAAESSAGDLGCLGKGKLEQLRTRRNRTRTDTRNSAKAVRRFLVKRSVLYPPYTAQMPLWGTVRCQQVLAPVSFLPIHETLDAVVKGPINGLPSMNHNWPCTNPLWNGGVGWLSMYSG
eukprot:1760619-Pyramimonas_sp.AAC.1